MPRSRSLGEHLGVNVTLQRREREVPPVPVKRAWRRYLAAVRACPIEAYEQAEETAWQRLVHELASAGHAPAQRPRAPVR
jgi:hypothetical protein